MLRARNRKRICVGFVFFIIRLRMPHNLPFKLFKE